MMKIIRCTLENIIPQSRWILGIGIIIVFSTAPLGATQEDQAGTSQPPSLEETLDALTQLLFQQGHISTIENWTEHAIGISVPITIRFNTEVLESVKQAVTAVNGEMRHYSSLDVSNQVFDKRYSAWVIWLAQPRALKNSFKAMRRSSGASQYPIMSHAHNFVSHLVKMELALEVHFENQIEPPCFYKVKKYNNWYFPLRTTKRIVPLKFFDPDGESHSWRSPAFKEGNRVSVRDSDWQTNSGVFAIFDQPSHLTIRLPIPEDLKRRIASISMRYGADTGGTTSDSRCDDPAMTGRLARSIKTETGEYIASASLSPEMVAQREAKEKDERRQAAAQFKAFLARHQATSIEGWQDTLAFLKNPYAYKGKNIYFSASYIKNISRTAAIVIPTYMAIGMSPQPGLPFEVQMDTDKNLSSMGFGSVRCIVHVLGTATIFKGNSPIEIPHVKEIECLE